MNKTFFVTTPIYYINDLPHVGHAYTQIAADTVARYYRQWGYDVLFSTGTDDNSAKTLEAAQKAGEDVQEYTEKMGYLWENTWRDLGIEFDQFIQTTSPAHLVAVNTFIARVQASGDIYKGTYSGLYCRGCEEFKTQRDLDSEGNCPEHKRPPELISEENYFFRVSRYKEILLEYIHTNPTFIQPESRKQEVISFIQNHLEDFSISRQNQSWGIPFPGDSNHRIYVWFDALINYLTATGFPHEEEKFRHFWPANLHIVGKGITKFHCAYWPAMLLSAGLPLPRHVVAHGHFTINGDKISKSLGNTINPLELSRQFGIDALRFYVLSEMPFGSDGNFSTERFSSQYQSQLANGLGNLASRIAKLCERATEPFTPLQTGEEAHAEYHRAMQQCAFQDALSYLWGIIADADKHVSESRLWEKPDEDLTRELHPLVQTLYDIGILLTPLLPQTAQKLTAHFGQNHIKAIAPVFPRKH